MSIEFNKETSPTNKGAYVAWVDPGDSAFRKEDRILLFWDGERWYYALSDQKYRGRVYAWAGPLPHLDA